jgi:hypothetical protein
LELWQLDHIWLGNIPVNKPQSTHNAGEQLGQGDCEVSTLCAARFSSVVLFLLSHCRQLFDLQAFIEALFEIASICSANAPLVDVTLYGKGTT